MHAAVCLLRAGQPRSAGQAAKSGQFIGQFSWVTGDPIVLKGLSMTVFIISVLSEIGIFGILKNVQKSFKFEIKPRTEISMVNTFRRCFLYFGCKCKFISLYLFILNERDFRIFFS